MRIMSKARATASPSQPPKKPVNLSINDDLLAAARDLSINLSATEAALEEAVAKARRERWLTDNEAAIAAYNERVDSNGVFSDGLRQF
jgi:antitoxin CcdA